MAKKKTVFPEHRVTANVRIQPPPPSKVPNEPVPPEWTQMLAKLVEIANDNISRITLSADRKAAVKKIVDSADLVFAVWQDQEAKHSVSYLPIKGGPLLGNIALGATERELSIQAINCSGPEEAMAMKQVFGDGKDYH